MFNFPKIERSPGFQYKTNFLKTVVLHFKYPANKSVAEHVEIWEDKLKENFPNRKPLLKGEIHIDMTDNTPLIQKTKTIAEGSEFKTKDNNTVIAFTNDFFSITILGEAYSNFNNTFENIKTNFFPLFKKAGINVFERLAIRKVNLFTFLSAKDSKPTGVLPMVFNNSIIDNILFFPCQDNLDSGITKLAFNKEDYHLNLIYGLLKGNTNLKQFVLDIDLFKLTADIPIDSVPEIMESINNEIFNIFNWAIQKSLLENLEIEGE